eukprot:gene17063-5271_t
MAQESGTDSGMLAPLYSRWLGRYAKAEEGTQTEAKKAVAELTKKADTTAMKIVMEDFQMLNTDV